MEQFLDVGKHVALGRVVGVREMESDSPPVCVCHLVKIRLTAFALKRCDHPPVLPEKVDKPDDVILVYETPLHVRPPSRSGRGLSGLRPICSHP